LSRPRGWFPQVQDKKESKKDITGGCPKELFPLVWDKTDGEQGVIGDRPRG